MCAGLLLLLAAVTAQADAEDRMAGVLVGGGILPSHLSDRTDTGMTYDLEWPLDWKSTSSWNTSVYLEFMLSRWGGCTGSDCEHLTDVGVMPVLRFHDLEPAGSPMYIDLGLGAHLISHTRIVGQVYSTAFQFSEIPGFGWLFGNYDIGVRYLHESNGNIKLPNDGMNFLLLRLVVRW